MKRLIYDNPGVLEIFEEDFQENCFQEEGYIQNITNVTLRFFIPGIMLPVSELTTYIDIPFYSIVGRQPDMSEFQKLLKTLNHVEGLAKQRQNFALAATQEFIKLADAKKTMFSNCSCEHTCKTSRLHPDWKYFWVNECHCRHKADCLLFGYRVGDMAKVIGFTRSEFDPYLNKTGRVEAVKPHDNCSLALRFEDDSIIYFESDAEFEFCGPVNASAK